MKYYQLTMDIERNNIVLCYFKRNPDLSQNIFCVGEIYHNMNEPLEFYYDKHEGTFFTDYLANDKGWFIVSQKLQDLLKILNTEIQFLPILIKEKNDNTMVDGYCIANILRIVDALCLEKSEYFETKLPGLGTIYTVSKYGIYTKETKRSDVFKLSNRQEIPIFVSEFFKENIEKNNLTGLSLSEIKAV